MFPFYLKLVITKILLLASMVSFYKHVLVLYKLMHMNNFFNHLKNLSSKILVSLSIWTMCMEVYMMSNHYFLLELCCLETYLQGLVPILPQSLDSSQSVVLTIEKLLTLHSVCMAIAAFLFNSKKSIFQYIFFLKCA